MIRFLLILVVAVVVFEESKVEGQGYFQRYSDLYLPKPQDSSQAKPSHNQRSILYDDRHLNLRPSFTGRFGYSKERGFSWNVGAKLRLDRKRRSAEGQNAEKAENILSQQPKADVPTVPPVGGERKVKVEKQSGISNQEKLILNNQETCDKCLEIQPLKVDDKIVENKTLEDNDFVMVVKHIDTNLSVFKLLSIMKFEVVDVLKSPIEKVSKGSQFTIRAEMADCPCLSILDLGYYVVTGVIDEKGRLTLSNVFMESNESQVQTGPQDSAQNFGQSFKVLGTKYGSLDEFDLAPSPSTSNFLEEGGWEDSDDEEEDDESQGAWPIAEEASGSLLIDGFESSEGRGKLPTFSIPGLPPVTEGGLLSKSFQDLQIFFKKLLKL
eukprot:gene4295-20495_t